MPITKKTLAGTSNKRWDLANKGTLLIGTMMYPAQTWRWMQFLKNQPVLRGLAPKLPHLLTRIHRPYLSLELSCAQRMDALMAHYELLFAGRFDSLVKKAALHPITLCEFNGKSSAAYQMQLSAIDRQQRDGELALRLFSKGVCIYTASFLLTKIDGEPCIRLGGLHGFLAVDNHLRIKRITRDLHGCRPKDLMVAVVREIGDCLGCRKILLIGNRNKIPVDRRVCKKSSDYDRIWAEMQAAPRADGDFELPCVDTPSVAGQSCNTLPRRGMLLDAILATVRKRLLEEKSSPSYFLSPEDRSPLTAELRSGDERRIE